MKIDDIIWLQKIVDKLETKHHISQEEVEQVFVNNPQYRFLEKGKIEGEMDKKERKQYGKKN